ncbi:MAG: hypothetical protein ABSB35_34655 [Bryobacteraceae bacterium]|jgi:hypothetical protein
MHIGRIQDFLVCWAVASDGAGRSRANSASDKVELPPSVVLNQDEEEE